MSVERFGYGCVFDGNSGPFVKYEDYAALEQKLAESKREFRAADATIENLQMQNEKLAAENAGLKQGTPDLQTMMSALDAFFADEELPERAMLAAYNILRGAVETPATDAFLAEVRAQGVEMFGQWLRDSADIFDKNSRHDWADQNRVSADKAGEFAEHLRKGVQS